MTAAAVTAARMRLATCVYMPHAPHARVRLLSALSPTGTQSFSCQQLWDVPEL